MKKIVKVMPFFEPRMWGGGSRLKEEFHYESNVQPIGEVYNVVALANHADCFVPEMNITLSQLYKQYPDWFHCDCDELPIRVNLLDPIADLSIQIHPDDEFAKSYNGGRGKPEAWVILDTCDDGYIQFGHHAKTKEEFIELTHKGEWKKLLKYLKAIKDGYIDIPTGTLHAIGKGVLTYNISRNADCTLRLYDYERIDPSTNQKRALQMEAVFANVNIPDTSSKFVLYPSVLESNIEVTRYCDQPGLYTLKRLQVKEEGHFTHDRFAFFTCVDGEGSINSINIRKGETILVPEGINDLQIIGKLDLFLASYRNKDE